jgi:hypothetical protein
MHLHQLGLKRQAKPAGHETSPLAVFSNKPILESPDTNLMLTEKIRRDILKKSKESYMAEGMVHK